MYTRRLGLASALVVCVAFSACPDDKESSGDTSTTSPDTTPEETADTAPEETADTGPDDTTDTTEDDTTDTTPEETTEDTTVAETEVVQPPGSGEVEALDPEASSLVLPFDSALSPDGTEVYYVSLLGSGDESGHQLFRSIDGEEEPLTTDAGFILPMGVITDGERVYVLDSGYLPADAEANVREGAILAVPVAGGSATVVSGTQGYAPVNGDVRDGTITFSGRDPADGVSGVFTIGTGGGVATVVHKGEPLVRPSGVATTSDGPIYVSDPVADQGAGAIIRISGSDASQLIGGLVLGTPAGIALAADEAYLLASALDRATETSVVLRIDLASGEVSDVYQPDNIKTNRDAGGLHCARDVEACVWSDISGPDGDLGVVYRVILK